MLDSKYYIIVNCVMFNGTNMLYYFGDEIHVLLGQIQERIHQQEREREQRQRFRKGSDSEKEDKKK
jgi:hypothetical protein